MTNPRHIGRSVLTIAWLAYGGSARAEGPGGPHGPPPEAIQACSGLQAGAACSVTFGDGTTMTSTCRAGPDGAALACGPGGPGGFKPPQEAVQACASLQDGAACSVTMPDGHAMTGTCRAPPDGSTLACVPPHPPHHR